MKAELISMNDVVVVNFSGCIDIEYSQLFHKACLNDIGGRSNKIIFNLKELNFVGSNGIIPFVRTLRDLADQSEKKVVFCQVGSEFRKIFETSPLANIEIFEDQNRALASLRNMDFVESH